MIEVIKLEIKKNLNKWFAICLICYLILAAVIMQVGIEKYKLDQAQSKQFIDVQVKRIKSFINYQQYGGYGISRLIIGSPLVSFFYNSSTVEDLHATIETSTQYKLFKPEMGKNLFERPTGGNLDFSWFYIIFYIAAVSTWCFFAFRNRDYIRFLKNFAGAKTIFLGIITGRLIMIMVINCLVAVSGWLLFLLNGIVLNSGEVYALLIFLLVSTLAVLILMVISAGWGATRNWKQGVLGIIICWIIIVMVWPEVLNAMFSRKAEIEMKPLTEHHLQKNEKLLIFEKEALENTGRYKSIQEREKYEKERIEYYWDVVSKEIEALDIDLGNRSERLARNFQFWSILNPITFYKSVNNETGSKGYNSYNRFFKENLKIQRGFLRFVFNKRYYENYTTVEPYLPAKELVKEARPSLPAFFLPGLIINLVYIIAAIFFTYVRFKKFIFPVPEVTGGYSQIQINALPGTIEFVTSDNDDLYQQIIKVFNRKHPGFNGEILVNHQKPIDSKEIRCVLVPNQLQIPGNLKIASLVKSIGKMAGTEPEKIKKLCHDYQENLKKQFSRLDAGDRASFLLDLGGLKNPELYVLMDFKKGVQGKNLVKVINRLRSLKKNKATILCLSEVFMTPDITYNYSFNTQEKKYDVLEDFNDTIYPLI